MQQIHPVRDILAADDAAISEKDRQGDVGK